MRTKERTAEEKKEGEEMEKKKENPFNVRKFIETLYNLAAKKEGAKVKIKSIEIKEKEFAKVN